MFPTYKIPVEKLTEDRLIYFDSHVCQHGEFEFSDKQIRPFVMKGYEELKNVSSEQVKVWNKDKLEGRQLFWFSHTTHVLYQGAIDVSEVEVIMCK